MGNRCAKSIGCEAERDRHLKPNHDLDQKAFKHYDLVMPTHLFGTLTGHIAIYPIKL